MPTTAPAAMPTPRPTLIQTPMPTTAPAAMPTPSEAEDAEPDALAEKALALVLGLHVIVICLHVLHVNVVTYVIFLLHTGEFTCKIIYM